MPSPFATLLHGHDTAECAYFLTARGACGIDFAALAVEKERLRQAKARDPKAITLGGTDFLLQPYGSSSGYPFVLTNPDTTISLGEFNSPSFFVKFHSLALWRDGLEALHRRFLGWAQGLGFVAQRPESLSRVDFAFDYHLPGMTFSEDAFVSRAAKDVRFRENGRVQTIQFGKGDVVLRVYDKVAEIAGESGKTWFFPLWGQDADVWRVEWQVRKPILRRFAVRTVDDLLDQQGDVLTWLATERDTLRVPTTDSNRSRWPLHPLWRSLQDQIASLNRQGVYRKIDTGGLLDERLMRMAISVNGYLKRVAAIECLKERRDHMTQPDALQRLSTLLARVHDPLTWDADVRQRMDEMRLGQ